MIDVLRNEWHILRRERGFWLLCGAFTLLLGYGCAQSALRVRALDAQIKAAVSDFERRWAGLHDAASQPGQAWGDWRSPSLVGGPMGFSITWLPIDGLMALSPGESRRLPLVKPVSIYRADEEPPLENPLVPTGGLFDLSFVVQWLLPLMIVAATHGVVSVDRQQGTWPLVAAITSHPARILAARLVWPTALLAGLTIVAGTTAVLLAAPVDGDGWIRLVAWWGLVIVYALFWALVTGTISARVSTAAASLTGAGLLWIALVWVAPGVLDAVVSASVPPANRVDAYIAGRDVERDLEQRLPSLLDTIYADHPEWRPSAAAIAAANTPAPGGPASRDSRRVYAPALASAQATAPFQRAVADRRQQTERLVSQWSIVSPALAVQSIADHLAGGSTERFLLFERHVVEGEHAWHAFFGPRIMRLQDITRADMDHVPPPTAFEGRPTVFSMVWPAGTLLVSLFVAGGLLWRSLPCLQG